MAPSVWKWRRAASAVIATCPGQAAAILRATMYRLLGISEPETPASVTLVPAPMPPRG